MGMSSKMVSTIRQLYKHTKTCVSNNNEESEFFESTQGLKQGCGLSPLLFTLFINDIEQQLSSGGIQIGDRVIKLLLYADDLVLFAESPSELQHMIDDLHSYCTTWNLIVNLNKSKIIIFRKGGRRAATEKWLYAGNEICIVNEYQ